LETFFAANLKKQYPTQNVKINKQTSETIQLNSGLVVLYNVWPGNGSSLAYSYNWASQ